MGLNAFSYTRIKKAQTSYCLLTIRGLRIAYTVNKQQETYADMTTPCQETTSTGNVIPIGIYWLL